MWEQTGNRPKELRDIEVPYAGLDIFTVFWDVFKHDTGVSWEDLYYYTAYTGEYLNGEELAIVRALSSAAKKWIMKKENAKNKGK